MNTTDKYYDSMLRFNRIDGDNYNGAMWQQDCGNFLLEARLNTKTKTVAIIQYWPNNNGYSVYVDETLLQSNN